MEEIGITIKEDPKKKESISVLFGWTSLDKESILIENYDFIQFKLNYIFENWDETEKESYFIYKGASEEVLQDRSGLEIISRDKYIFHEPIHNQHLVAFLNSGDIKFDVVILGECANLIEMFWDSQKLRSLFDADIKLLFNKIKDFYNGLKSNGIFINLYYNENDGTTSFSNLEVFYDYSCIWSLDVYLFILRVMNQLFKKVEPGIYQKERVENIDKILEDTYQKIIEELLHITVDKVDHSDQLIDAIDKTYFGGELVKSNTFSVERPLLHNITNLIKESLEIEE